MSNADVNVIAPKFLIVPTISNLTSDPQTGTLCMSGSKLFCFSGSGWIELSGSNTGD